MRVGMAEIIPIVVIILILFGAKRIPEIAAALRDAIKEFKKEGKDIEKGLKEDDKKE